MTRRITVPSNPIKPKPRLIVDSLLCVNEICFRAPLILPRSCEGVVNALRARHGDHFLFTPPTPTLSPSGERATRPLEPAVQLAQLRASFPLLPLPVGVEGRSRVV